MYFKATHGTGANQKTFGISSCNMVPFWAHGVYEESYAQHAILDALKPFGREPMNKDLLVVLHEKLLKHLSPL
jgi:hypothetical protein